MKHLPIFFSLALLGACSSSPMAPSSAPVPVAADIVTAPAVANVANLGLVGFECGAQSCRFTGRAQNVGTATAVSVSGTTTFGDYAPITVSVPAVIAPNEIVEYTGVVVQDKRGLPGLVAVTRFTWTTR